MKHFLSLGAGVQSSTMALMAAHGEITPMPDAAIFADTQAEPASVYRWLDWLEKKLPFPVHRVTAGNLAEAGLDTRASVKGSRYFKTSIPFYTLSSDGSSGRIMARSCTQDYKVAPIRREIKRLAAVKRNERSIVACSWIGISLDEIQRAKPPRDKWLDHRWPLIEMRITRLGCLDWMKAKSYPEPPRSACTFCPFHSDKEWRHLKLNDPDGFAEAVQFDHAIRHARDSESNLKSTPYVHRSLKPLDEVDLRNDEDHGQLLLWQDECTGMCGV